MNTSSEENNNQDSSSSEEKTISETSFKFDDLQKIIINKNLILFLAKDCSYASLTPIIPTNRIDFLFKLYQLPFSKEEMISKIKNYIDKQEAKIDKIYTINDIRVHKSHGNITIIDEQFNNNCINLSKQSNNALQIISDKIALNLFNTKNIKYKYEKASEQDKMIYAMAYLKSDECIKSDLFETEKSSRNDVNRKIIIKYLPKKISKEILNNIEHLMNMEDKKKLMKKERYEMYLSEAGFDHKLLNKKRNLTVEELSKRLPYYNMLKNNKKKTRNEKCKNNNFINKRPNKNNKIILDEEDEDFFVNTEGTPLNEILLGDPIIVNNHLRDFKYTPLKLFEMIRDSEKYRGIDFKIDYSRINDKNYSVNFQAVIISQKLGIKVEGFGNAKEEAGNKCALNLLAVLFKNIFKTYYQVHDYFENKNGRYLDIILKTDDDDNNNDKEELNVNNNPINNNIRERKFINNQNNNKKFNKNKNNKINIINKKIDVDVPRSKFENWINYNINKNKIKEDSDYKLSKDSNDDDFPENFNKSSYSINYNESESQQNLIEDNKKSNKSSSENQENFPKFNFDQIISSMNNTSSSDINIINNLDKYNLSNSSGTREIEELMKNSELCFSESNYSISNGTKKKLG